MKYILKEHFYFYAIVLTVLEGINQAITTYLISLTSKQKLIIKKVLKKWKKRQSSSDFSFIQQMALRRQKMHRWHRQCNQIFFDQNYQIFQKKRHITNRPIRPSSKTLYL